MPEDGFDWLHASNADRALLYETLKQLVDRGAITWNYLFDAVGLKPGEDYLENFRRGLNSRKHCLQYYAYLQANFPSETDALDRKLQPQRTASSWESYFKENRTDNLLIPVPMRRHETPMFSEPPGKTNYYNDESFYLQLNSPIEGQAVCLRGSGRSWYVAHVAPATLLPVHIGQQWLTRDWRSDLELRGHWLMRESESTNIPKPIRLEMAASIAVIVGHAELVAQIASMTGVKHPIQHIHLDALPTLLRTCRGPWIIAWTRLQIRARLPTFSNETPGSDIQ